MPRSSKYQDFLIEQLQDHDFAVAYLNEALKESLKDDKESKQRFWMALRNVAEGQGDLGKLAKKAHVGRESLYKILSRAGNPKWHTLVSLLVSLGLNLKFT
jgi:probable addiction module antidote protein